MTKKALIAMSGGVDSSVAAFLTKDMGYDATGITLKLFDNEDIEHICLPTHPEAADHDSCKTYGLQR